jgi:hypothetical protein
VTSFVVPTRIFLEGLRKFVKNLSGSPGSGPSPNTPNFRKLLGDGTNWIALLYKAYAAADINDRQLHAEQISAPSYPLEKTAVYEPVQGRQQYSYEIQIQTVERVTSQQIVM